MAPLRGESGIAIPLLKCRPFPRIGKPCAKLHESGIRTLNGPSKLPWHSAIFCNRQRLSCARKAFEPRFGSTADGPKTGSVAALQSSALAESQQETCEGEASAKL